MINMHWQTQHPLSQPALIRFKLAQQSGDLAVRQGSHHLWPLVFCRQLLQQQLLHLVPAQSVMHWVTYMARGKGGVRRQYAIRKKPTRATCHACTQQ